MATITKITNVGAFTDDTAAQINTNLTNLNAAVGAGLNGLAITATTGGVLTVPNNVTVTVFAASDTVVGRASTDTLTNKTLVAPALGAATATSLAATGAVTGGAGAQFTTLNYIATENGANNAIACAAASGPALTTGLVVTVLLAHSLQAGANTFAYNGGATAAIKQNTNPATDIGTAYVSGGVIVLFYDGTRWLELS